MNKTYKEKVIEMLRGMIEHKLKLAKKWEKKGREDISSEKIAHRSALLELLTILQDEELFEYYCSFYKKEGNQYE